MRAIRFKERKDIKKDFIIHDILSPEAPGPWDGCLYRGKLQYHVLCEYLISTSWLLTSSIYIILGVLGRHPVYLWKS
jgi:hypothetical protein